MGSLKQRYKAAKYFHEFVKTFINLITILMLLKIIEFYIQPSPQPEIYKMQRKTLCNQLQMIDK